MRFVGITCLWAGIVVAIGCAGGGVPTGPSAVAAASGSAAGTAVNGSQAMSAALAAAPRSGDLHVQKECSHFGDGYCSITVTNVKAIEVGSKVLYLQPELIGTEAGSDVILDPPGPGGNRAFGHCSVATGVCTFSGGTGKFTHFQAHVAVFPNADASVWYWEGTYSFEP